MSNKSEINYILENIHFLLEAGIPMTSCLDVLAKKNNSFNILKIKEEILLGKTFHQAFMIAFNYKIPNVVNMFLQIGESCGNLGSMIIRSIETDRQIKKINDSFIGAISYPLFITIVAMIMMFLIMIGIVPKLLPMFRDLHVELPIYTKFFMIISSLVTRFVWYVFFGLIALIGSFVYFFKKFEVFKIKIENLILKMWGIGSLYVRYHTSIIALCVSEYLRAGYAFHNAMKMVSDSVQSFAYRDACSLISIELQKGNALSEVIKSHEKLMPEWSYVLDLAGQTGRLSEQFERFYLENLAYLEKTNNLIKRWSEPALMLIIGGIIAVFAVSIISPIYSVIQNVQI